MPKLDFSYSDTFSDTFSVKTSSRDTIYFEQLFPNRGLKQGTYFVIASQQFKDTLQYYVDQIQFSQLDSLYHEDYEDGSVFKLCTGSQNIEKCILVHSKHAPQELNQLAQFILKEKGSWVCEKIDTIIYFPSQKAVYSMPNLEGVKFLPPN